MEKEKKIMILIKLKGTEKIGHQAVKSSALFPGKWHHDKQLELWVNLGQIH